MNQPNLDHLLGEWSGDDEDYDPEDDVSTMISSNMLVSKYYQQEAEPPKQEQSKASSSKQDISKKQAGKSSRPATKMGPARNRFEKVPVARPAPRTAQGTTRMNHPKALAKPANQNSKAANVEASITALYRTKSKASVATNAEPKAKYQKVNHFISKPTKPLLRPQFYEQHWGDERLIEQSLESGKIVSGRVYFDQAEGQKMVGFVMPDPISVQHADQEAGGDKTETLQMRPIKIWGLRHLNRAYHMDRVYVKFVNWIEWGTAGNKLISNIDFEEHLKFQIYGQNQLNKDINKSIKEQRKSQEDGQAGEAVAVDEFAIAKKFKIESVPPGRVLDQQLEAVQEGELEEQEAAEEGSGDDSKDEDEEDDDVDSTKKKVGGKKKKRRHKKGGKAGGEVAEDEQRSDQEQSDQESQEESDEDKDEADDSSGDDTDSDDSDDDSDKDDGTSSGGDDDSDAKDDLREESEEEEDHDDYYDYEYYGADKDQEDDYDDEELADKDDGSEGAEDIMQDYDEEYADEVANNIKNMKKAGINIMTQESKKDKIKEDKAKTKKQSKSKEKKPSGKSANKSSKKKEKQQSKPKKKKDTKPKSKVVKKSDAAVDDGGPVQEAEEQVEAQEDDGDRADEQNQDEEGYDQENDDDQGDDDDDDYDDEDADDDEEEEPYGAEDYYGEYYDDEDEGNSKSDQESDEKTDEDDQSSDEENQEAEDHSGEDENDQQEDPNAVGDEAKSPKKKKKDKSATDPVPSDKVEENTAADQEQQIKQKDEAKQASEKQEEAKEQENEAKAKPKEKPVFFIPTITKPPIFKSKKQLISFFGQEEIAKLRPLGKIVGFVKKKKPELEAKKAEEEKQKQEEKKKQEEQQQEDKPEEKNAFWAMAGYQGPAPGKKDENPEEEKIEHPTYDPPHQLMKSLIHTGTMKRVRMNKEKSEYRQIITPNPDYTLPPEVKDSKKQIQVEKISQELKQFQTDYFGAYLPKKLMVVDRKLKHLKEVRVRFKVTGAWNEFWPMAKVIEIL